MIERVDSEQQGVAPWRQAGWQDDVTLIMNRAAQAPGGRLTSREVAVERRAVVVTSERWDRAIAAEVQEHLVIVCGLRGGLPVERDRQRAARPRDAAEHVQAVAAQVQLTAESRVERHGRLWYCARAARIVGRGVALAHDLDADIGIAGTTAGPCPL